MLQIKGDRWLEILRCVVACIIAWAVAARVQSWLEPAHYDWKMEVGVVCVTSLAWLGVVAILTYALRLDQVKNEAAALWARVQRRFIAI
jgi:lysylphosphatidylglycerol synthetase-like protein (DUF2156 family)